MKIYKYKLGNNVQLPKDARILHCTTQEKCLHVWALVDPDATEFENFDVQVIGTGHAFNPDGWEYISTVLDGLFVWHIWFKKSKDEWEFS
jgi:hypothetical protein